MMHHSRLNYAVLAALVVLFVLSTFSSAISCGANQVANREGTACIDLVPETIRCGGGYRFGSWNHIERFTCATASADEAKTVTGIAFSSSPGDAKHLTAEVRPVYCPLSGFSTIVNGSRNFVGEERQLPDSRIASAFPGATNLVITGVGMSMHNPGNVTNISLLGRPLPAGCTFGDPQYIYHSGAVWTLDQADNTEEFERLPDGYYLVGVGARATDGGNIASISLQTKAFVPPSTPLITACTIEGAAVAPLNGPVGESQSNNYWVKCFGENGVQVDCPLKWETGLAPGTPPGPNGSGNLRNDLTWSSSGLAGTRLDRVNGSNWAKLLTGNTPGSVTLTVTSKGSDEFKPGQLTYGNKGSGNADWPMNLVSSDNIESIWIKDFWFDDGGRFRINNVENFSDVVGTIGGDVPMVNGIKVGLGQDACAYKIDRPFAHGQFERQVQTQNPYPLDFSRYFNLQGNNSLYLNGCDKEAGGSAGVIFDLHRKQFSCSRTIEVRNTYLCQGELDGNASFCSGSNTGLTQDGQTTLVNSCDNAPKCSATCNTGFVLQGDECVPTSSGPDDVFVCDDSAFNDPYLTVIPILGHQFFPCPNNAFGLTHDTPGVTVPSCTGSRPCEYTCAPSKQYVNSTPPRCEPYLSNQPFCRITTSPVGPYHVVPIPNGPLGHGAVIDVEFKNLVSTEAIPISSSVSCGPGNSVLYSSCDNPPTYDTSGSGHCTFICGTYDTVGEYPLHVELTRMVSFGIPVAKTASCDGTQVIRISDNPPNNTCTGSVPDHSVRCFASANPSTPQNYSLVVSCSGNSAGNECTTECNLSEGYTWKPTLDGKGFCDQTITVPTPQCTGSIPTGAARCFSYTPPSSVNYTLIAGTCPDPVADHSNACVTYCPNGLEAVGNACITPPIGDKANLVITGLSVAPSLLESDIALQASIRSLGVNALSSMSGKIDLLDADKGTMLGSIPLNQTNWASGELRSFTLSSVDWTNHFDQAVNLKIVLTVTDPSNELSSGNVLFTQVFAPKKKTVSSPDVPFELGALAGLIVLGVLLASSRKRI